MRLGITDTVKHLLIINVVMFVGTMAIGNGELFYKWFALYFPENSFFKPWQIITHMFMHGGASFPNFSITHLLFNMFALWMFGTAVEQRLGSKKFIFLYISAGLGAVLFQLGYNYYEFYSIESILLNNGLSKSEVFELMFNSSAREKVPMLKDLFDVYRTSMVGASGCIMGVLAAFGIMNPNAELMLIFLPIPIKAKYFIPGIIILDIISAISGQSFFSPSNTAYLAHVGGAVVGALIMWYWRKNQFDNFRWN